MKELIGYECCCVFNLPATEWPISGYPAWVVVDAVDMPMIKMRSQFGGKPMWLHVGLIKTIEATRRERHLVRWPGCLYRAIKFVAGKKLALKLYQTAERVGYSDWWQRRFNQVK